MPRYGTCQNCGKIFNLFSSSSFGLCPDCETEEETVGDEMPLHFDEFSDGLSIDHFD